ncbi:aminoacyl-tRNA hydrolase [Candidatus Micrarchaeota archaeon CG11_big_fil_rev_8_21_14_0_20_47_5]|nr:MAG: aminoacyl-tRNA hydrolase [Candidatus Micrarchaeota archaeon CG1_02_47_40]PIN83324.1 MAG: aminoacyl-tRNA hydrolase [Candidatus Micrarchaeota archaeon CG11_big_fil_rev_8_21_14_0_20_47_5]
MIFGIFERVFGKGSEGEVKQVIVVRTDLKMGVGKIAGQVGHAAVLGYKKVTREFPSLAERWEEEGARKVVVKVGSEKEFFSLYEKVKCRLPCALVHDAGKTQIKAGTPTCFAIGPYYEKEIDEFTKEMKLL